METKLLTYAELADALGITAASAKRLANRRKWAKSIGNDGLSRVYVPLERLETPKKGPRPVTSDDAEDASDDDAGDDTRGDTEGVPGDARALIAVLETRIAELQGRVVDLDAEAKAGRIAISELTAKAVRVDVLEALLEAERRHAGELRGERDKLLDKVLTAEPAGILARLRKVLIG